MNRLPLSLKILLRSWRGGQLGLIFSSLVMAVAVVSSVAMLADRVERALVAESSSFLAADALVKSSQPIPDDWITQAVQDDVTTALSMVFTSMVFHGDNNHLASVKAVQRAYPLRGTLTLSTTPFATDPSLHQIVNYGPPQGEAWVDGRILPLLNIQIGDTIDVGEVSLKVTQTIISEPDRGDSFSLFGARVLMNWQDVEASEIVQPGSRVGYRLLVAGEDKPLGQYLQWLKPQLDVHGRLLSPDEAQASINETMQRGRRFLLLAGSIGVVLAGIALALASRHYASGQASSVALMKSWGVAAKRVRNLYWQQSFWLGLAGIALGIFVGWLFHEVLINVIREWLPVTMPAAGWRSWLTGFATGWLCLLGFALPALWHLPSQSPLAVLREDVHSTPVSAMRRGILGIVAVMVMLFWYSNSWLLSLSILAGFALTATTTVTLGWLLLRLAKSWSERAGSVWRLALANLWRRRQRNLLQMIGFAGAIAMLMSMGVIRTSLIDQWRWQLADDAPNHFLVNVAPYELETVESMLAERQLKTAGWYSMVRGRITHINGEVPSDELKDREEELRRELNLSWTAQLPEGNSIEQGVWWQGLGDFVEQHGENTAPISIERDMAEEIGVTLGDRLTFSIGGFNFEGVITSTRALNWDNMTPNFYILFPEGQLETFPRTYMTSLYVPPQEKSLVNEVLQAYPTILVIELDIIIDRIRTIVSQITWGLELMTLLILACGILVMFATVNLSMRERLQESAILRTLGSSRSLILKTQWIEFCLLGAIAGILGAGGAELAVSILQYRMFGVAFEPHWWLWLVGPLAGGVLTGMLGVIYSRRVVVQPPLQVLRSV